MPADKQYKHLIAITQAKKMINIFKNINLNQKREKLIKENILSVLHNNAKEIQYEFTIEGDLEEAKSVLCEILESMFLHGLKDSFLSQTLSAVIITDTEYRPEPSFWSPLLIFLHKEDITHIQSLSQINSEIGCCRSWIRMSLNVSSMSSYLNNIKQNKNALDPYYKKYAFMKDGDSMDIATKLIESIENVCEFEFPINSSLYNMWSNNALHLSGLWTPPLKSCPVDNGYDIASSITNEIPVTAPESIRTNEIFPDSISNSPFRNLNDNITHFNKDDELNAANEIIEYDSEKASELKTQESPKDNLMGNSLNSLLTSSTWSTYTANNENSNMITNKSFERSDSSISRKSTQRYSYNAILKKHETERVIDWTDVWKKFESTLSVRNDDENVEKEYEIIPSRQSSQFSIENVQKMVELTCQLAVEKGLDQQGFLCDDCAHPIGMDFSEPRKCAFSGKYVCISCISLESILIPAKVIYNWDFKKYNISKKYHTFLVKYRLQPFLNIKILNPDIYKFSTTMANMQSLRIRLNFIRAYLCTCCTQSINTFKKIVDTKEYLYEHIHEYCIEDLSLIEKSNLENILQEAALFGESHILACKLCRLKGFHCEICRSSNVLYPFHIDTTFHCKECGAVFHDTCLNSSTPCPKCERRRSRT